MRSWFGRPAVHARELMDLLGVSSVHALGHYIDGPLLVNLNTETRFFQLRAVGR